MHGCIAVGEHIHQKHDGGTRHGSSISKTQHIDRSRQIKHAETTDDWKKKPLHRPESARLLEVAGFEGVAVFLALEAAFLGDLHLLVPSPDLQPREEPARAEPSAKPATSKPPADTPRAAYRGRRK